MTTASKETFALPPMPSTVDSEDEESFVVLSTDYGDSIDFGTSHQLTPLRNDVAEEAIKSLTNAQKSLPETSSSSNPSRASQVPTESAHSATGSTLSTDSSYGGEVQNQVEQLIKENKQYKKIIIDNTEAMKIQMERMEQINNWKQEMENAVDVYKKRVHELNALVEKYKDDNVKLVEEVDEYKKIKGLQDEEIMILKKQLANPVNLRDLADKSQQNLREFNLQATNQKIADLEKKLSAMVQDKETAVADRIKLEVIIHQDAEEIAAMGQDLADKNDEIVQLQKKNAEYQKRIETLKNAKDEEIELRALCIQLREENNKLTEKIADSARYQELIHLKEEQLEKLKDELVESQERHESLKKYMGEELEYLRRQLKEYETTRPLNQEQVQQLRQQLMESQRSITEMQSSLDGAQTELITVRYQLQVCNDGKDEIFALNEQLTLYKNDFEAEKESRKEMERQKRQVEDDLQNLQRRNRDMQAELEMLRPNGFVVCDRPITQRATNDSPVSSQMDFECPKCSFKFKNYQALENHVFRCLELEGFP